MRIVSLCPSLTELVFDLGRGADLVGITTWCVHPADGVKRIETVGGTKNPDVIRIAAIAPDLVLLNEEENRAADAAALETAGVPCLTTFPRTVGETADMVRAIGAALDRPEESERIATDIEARAERVRAVAKSSPPVSFAYLIWNRPLMTVNGDTFADDLLSLAGGRNTFSERSERYPRIEADELRAADPELILLCTEPFAFEEEHADALAEETGLDRARFHVADGEYLSWHGSRTPAGIDYAEGLIKAAR